MKITISNLKKAYIPNAVKNILKDYLGWYMIDYSGTEIHIAKKGKNSVLEREIWYNEHGVIEYFDTDYIELYKHKPKRKPNHNKHYEACSYIYGKQICPECSMYEILTRIKDDVYPLFFFKIKYDNFFFFYSFKKGKFFSDVYYKKQKL